MVELQWAICGAIIGTVLTFFIERNARLKLLYALEILLDSAAYLAEQKVALQARIEELEK